jgi:TRAP-type C4-dicarboxylate transport system permease small subunit
MRRSFLAVERVVTGASLLGAAAMLALAASLGLYQIVTRFVLEQPAEWTEVLIRFSLIWMVFLGLGAAHRQGAMVCVDVLHRWSPAGMKRFLEWAVAAVSIAFLLYIAWIGWDYARRGSVQTVAGLEAVSMFWAYLAVPVGCVLSLFGALGNALDPKREDLELAQ